MRETTNQLSSRVFFPNLDGIRFVAFFMVFCGHTFDFSKLGKEHNFFEQLLLLFCSGGTGVSIFFVLSGFLITFLLIHEKETKKGINIGHFYMRRLLRIWPLYFAVLFFAFFIYPFIKSQYSESVLLGDPIYHFLFLSNFDVINLMNNRPETVILMQANTWSVAVEEQFYLIWPLIFLFVPRRFYMISFLLIIAMGFLFRYIHRNDYHTLYYHSLSVCTDLAIGGLCAYLSYYSKKFISTIGNLSKSVIISLYFIGIIWLSIANDQLYKTPVLSLSRIINVAFFAFIILEQNYSKNSFYKFSQFKFLSFWGKYTYGLYLLHPILLYLCEVLFFKVFQVNPRESVIYNLPFAFIVLAVSLGVSYCSYHYFELWFLKLKDHFYGASRPTVTKEPELLILKPSIISER